MAEEAQSVQDFYEILSNITLQPNY